MIPRREIIIVLLALITLFTTLDACKRIAPSGNPVQRKKAKIDRPVAEIQQSNWNLPVDLFMEICQHFLNGLRTGRTLQNPMIPLYLVSKFWNHEMHKEVFRKFLLGQPKYSLLLLKISFSLDTQYHLDLLEVAKPVIEIEAAMKLLIQAKTADHLKLLPDIPAFNAYNISKTTYNQYLSYAHRHGHLKKIVPSYIDDVLDFRKGLKEHIDDIERLRLKKIPSLEIAKLMFLEDIYKWESFSSVFRFAKSQLFKAYRKKKETLAAPLIAALNGSKLPKSRLDASFVVSSYHLFLAAYIGDRNFFDYMEPDFNTPHFLENIFRKLVDILKQFQAGLIEYYPADQLHLAEKLLRSRSDIEHTFPKRLFRQRRETILNDPSVPEVDKQVVRQYLTI